MNPQLNLKKYFFEKVGIELPKFLSTKETVSIKRSITGYTQIYHHRRDKNQFAMRWIFKFTPKIKNKKKRDVFRLEVAIVGIFKFNENNLSNSQKEKHLINKAPKMLYEMVKQSILSICKNSLIEGIRFPDLKSKPISRK